MLGQLSDGFGGLDHDISLIVVRWKRRRQNVPPEHAEVEIRADHGILNSDQLDDRTTPPRREPRQPTARCVSMRRRQQARLARREPF